MRGLLIGGEEVRYPHGVAVVNPASEEVIEEVSVGDRDAVRHAIDLAYEAFDELSGMPLRERSRVLLKASSILESRLEEFAKVLALEAGKPIRDARVEALRAVEVLRLSAEEARFVLEGRIPRVDSYHYPPGNEGRMVLEVREPIGVVAAILPFNFPLNSMAHKVAPNIAAGNPVVVKPSILTPLSALELGKVFYEAGLPKGALSVVVGPSSIIGEELVTHGKVRGVSFTGSTQTGVKVASLAVGRGKRIAMEMGGSDPMIVFGDADLARAVEVAVRARYEYAGQNCNSAKRIIVEEGVLEKFTSLFAERARKLRLGDPLDASTDVGPLISREALERISTVVEEAVSEGSQLVLGGSRRGDRGFYYEVTAIKNPPLESRLMKEEVFGPVAPITGFSGLEEAVHIANSTEYGLQASIFTSDLKKALRVARELEAGGVMINDSTRLRWDSLPFGGVKLSGLGGREGVRSTIVNFTEEKIISINLS